MSAQAKKGVPIESRNQRAVACPKANGPKVSPSLRFQAPCDQGPITSVCGVRALAEVNRAQPVVNITSVSVKQPIDGLLLSNTVRAGLTGWAKTLSNEVAAEGVTVNNVAPGYTLTEHQDEVAGLRGRASGKTREEMIEAWASEIPMARLARPEEIGAAVAFLASERASYITGVTLHVDGGWVRGLY